MEPHARRVGRRAGRQSARRPLRQRGRLAFLHRARPAGGETGPVIPPGSLLARWQAASTRRRETAAGGAGADAAALRPPRGEGKPGCGPVSPALLARRATVPRDHREPRTGREGERPRRPRRPPATAEWGLDPALFGRHPARPADRRREPLRAGAVGPRGSTARRPRGRLRVRRDGRHRQGHRRGRERPAPGTRDEAGGRVYRSRPASPSSSTKGAAPGNASRPRSTSSASSSRRRSATPRGPGGRGRHAHAVPPRGRAPRPADARRRPEGAARPAVGRAALRQPRRPERSSTPSSS